MAVKRKTSGLIRCFAAFADVLCGGWIRWGVCWGFPVDIFRLVLGKDAVWK